MRIAKLHCLIFYVFLLSELIDLSLTSSSEYQYFEEICSRIINYEDYYSTPMITNDDTIIHINLNLLCKLSVRDSRVLRSTFNNFISEIFNLTDIPCNKNGYLIDDLDTYYLDTKLDFFGVSDERKDIIRSKILTCSKGLFSLTYGSYSAEDVIVARNTIDLYSGFIKPESSYYQDFVHDKLYNDNFFIYFSTFGLDKNNFTVNDYRVPLRTKSLVSNYTNLRSDELKINIESGDYLLTTISEYRIQYLELECKSVEKYKLLIEDVSLLMTNVRIMNGTLAPETFTRLKYDVMYGPAWKNLEEIGIWIALNNHEFTSRSMDIQSEVESSNNEHGNYSSKDYNEIYETLLLLLSDLENSHSKFFQFYYLSQVNDRVSTRASKSVDLYLEILNGDTICL